MRDSSMLGMAKAKHLIEEYRLRFGLSLIAVETDVERVHVFVSAPPLVARRDRNVLKGFTLRYLRERFPHRSRHRRYGVLTEPSGPEWNGKGVMTRPSVQPT
jgi:REP element-mobilizing transposase RayT